MGQDLRDIRFFSDSKANGKDFSDASYTPYIRAYCRE